MPTEQPARGTHGTICKATLMRVSLGEDKRLPIPVLKLKSFCCLTRQDLVLWLKEISPFQTSLQQVFRLKSRLHTKTKRAMEA